MNDAEFGAKVMRLVLLVNSVRTAAPQSFAEAEIVRDCQTAIGEVSRELLTEVCRAILDQPLISVGGRIGSEP